MPYFVLHRDYVLRSTKGRSVRFTKDKSVWVPPVMVPDAVAVGAQPVSEQVDVIPNDAAPAQLTPDQRIAKITEGIEQLFLYHCEGLL